MYCMTKNTTLVVLFLCSSLSCQMLFSECIKFLSLPLILQLPQLLSSSCLAPTHIRTRQQGRNNSSIWHSVHLQHMDLSPPLLQLQLSEHSVVHYKLPLIVKRFLWQETVNKICAKATAPKEMKASSSPWSCHQLLLIQLFSRYS